MYYLFLTPAMTGKTTNAEALRKHLGMETVIELEALKLMSRAVRLRTHTNRKVLVLGTPEEITDDLVGFVRVKLTRDQCNAAMMAVGGYRIWNEDGSRFEVKFV